MISSRCYDHRGGGFTGWSSYVGGQIKGVMIDLYCALKEVNEKLYQNKDLRPNYFVDLSPESQLSILRQTIVLRDILIKDSKEQKLVENCIKLMLDTRRISYDIVEIFENFKGTQALVDDNIEAYWDYC